MKANNPYDKRYTASKLYWGDRISSMCKRVLQHIQPTDTLSPSLIDIGCGEGQNLVWFTKNGFSVTGFDSSTVGLEKASQLAREADQTVKLFIADIKAVKLPQKYDILFSSGVLHYLSPGIRQERFEHFKSQTTSKGLNVFSVFVEKPFIDKAPDAEETAYLYKSGELFGYYHDWKILYSTEEIINCNSSGIPHRHAINRIIAQHK